MEELPRQNKTIMTTEKKQVDGLIDGQHRTPRWQVLREAGGLAATVINILVRTVFFFSSGVGREEGQQKYKKRAIKVGHLVMANDSCLRNLVATHGQRDDLKMATSFR